LKERSLEFYKTDNEFFRNKKTNRWDIIMLAREKELDDREMSEKKKEEELKRICRTELIKQINSKRQAQQKEAEENFRNEMKMIKKWKTEERSRERKERALKYARMIDARRQLKISYDTKQFQIEKTEREKNEYTQYITELENTLKSQDKVIEDVKRSGEKEIKEHNRTSALNYSQQRKKDEVERYRKEKIALDLTIQRLEFEENRWKTEVKRREEQTEKIQREAVKRLRDIIFTTKLDKKKQSWLRLKDYEEKNYKDDVGHKLIEMLGNRNKAELAISLKESLAKQEQREKQKVRRRDKKAEIRREQEREYNDKRRQLMLLKRWNASKYCTDLLLQMKERSKQKEHDMTYTEYSINKSYFK